MLALAHGLETPRSTARPKLDSLGLANDALAARRRIAELEEVLRDIVRTRGNPQKRRDPNAPKTPRRWAKYMVPVEVANRAAKLLEAPT